MWVTVCAEANLPTVKLVEGLLGSTSSRANTDTGLDTIIASINSIPFMHHLIESLLGGKTGNIGPSKIV